MNYVVTMLELWSLLLICLIVGRRLVDLLPNVMGRTIGLYIAPILGLAFLVLFATLYGWLSPFKPTYSIPLTIIFVAVSIVCETRKRELVNHGFYVCVFALLCALPILAPLIRYSGYNPLTDIFTYLAQGQWLQSHSFAEKLTTSGYYPALTQIALYQETGSRMGGTFFIGYVQSLFALKWSYYAYMPTVSVGFVAGCLSIGGIIRQVIPVKRVIILALALLPSVLMNGFVYGAEWGFFPQTFGLAFAVGVCALFPYLTIVVVKRIPTWSQMVIYVLPVSICTAALLFAYNEPFPIFVGAIGLFLLIMACTHAGQIKTMLLFSGVYLIETLILINYEIIRIANNIYQTLAISNGVPDIGWPVLWSPIQFLAFAFGMKSPFNSRMFSLDSLVSNIVAPIVVAVMMFTLIQFMRTKPKRRATILFLFCLELVLLLFFIKFRYLSLNKSIVEVGHTFLQFKIAKYAAPFSIALLSTFAAIVWYYFKSQRTWFVWLYGLVFIVGVYFHGVIVSKNFTNQFLAAVKQRHAPFDVLLTLRAAVADIPADQVIHVALGPDQSKLRQMVAYVLSDRKISSDYRDDGYIVGRLPPEDRLMTSEHASRLLIMRQPQDVDDAQNRLVGPFIIQKPPFHYVLPGKQDGGYNTESNDRGDTWNWVGHAIDFPYTLVGQYQMVKIKCMFKSHRESRSLHIVLRTQSGLVLANYTLSLQPKEKAFESPWIQLNSNESLVLHVESDGQSSRLSMLDGREASFMITNATLSSR
ncbi:MAG: hypothetical protein Q8R24_07350 [Legionellaceae bacterium]|nr:hypothetical protein [Legionellaceae bacterium]